MKSSSSKVKLLVMFIIGLVFGYLCMKNVYRIVPKGTEKSFSPFDYLPAWAKTKTLEEQSVSTSPSDEGWWDT